MALSLCFRFCIFDRPILEKYVSQVEGGPHLLKSCLHATQNGLLPTTKEMHPCFLESGNYRHTKSTCIFDGHPP